jgi:hypothetical protein
MNPSDIKAAFLKKKWFPSTLAELWEKPFDIYRGITNYDWDKSEICAIHPLSLFTQIWYTIYRFWYLIYLVLLPLGIAYPDRNLWLIPISIITGFLVMIDTYIQLNMGIILDQELEMTPFEVRSYHRQKYTIINNLISGFPYVIITNLATASNSLPRIYSNLVCLINCNIAFGMIKSPNSSLAYEKFRQLIQTHEVNQTVVTLFTITIFMCYYFHWYSCSIRFLTDNAAILNLYPSLSEADSYAIQFFASVSLMFSSGWGVAGPLDTADRIPKIVNMLLSAVLLCLFTANITTYMIRLDSSGRQFTEKLEEVSQYIMYKQLGNDLRDRIVRYYHFKYNKGKYFDENKILNELSSPIRVVRILFFLFSPLPCVNVRLSLLKFLSSERPIIVFYHK